MRDALLLRGRVEAWLAAAALVPAAAGCGDRPARPVPAPSGSDESEGADAAQKSEHADEKVPEKGTASEPAPATPAPKGPNARFEKIQGDPPFVDGYNPEEATCPSGNWCGAPEAVAKVALPHVDDVMGCAGRISGSIGRKNGIDGPAFDGLSKIASMQGSFNEGRTRRRRADGDGAVCCYHWFEYCSGRPLMDGGAMISAASRPGRGWRTPMTQDRAAPNTEALDPSMRARLADEWEKDALAEHASVAAFNRLSLELMALAAPHDLLMACQQAALDEVDHARRCFALASAYRGTPLEPGPLRPVPVRTLDFPTLVREAFREGCVGETVAALVAERAAAACEDPAVNRDLERIAQDEARHAAFAWSVVRWALQVGGSEAREALRAVLDETADPAHTGAEPAPSTARGLLAHGRLGPRDIAAAHRDALRLIVRPLGEDLLATV